jgi:hypothetical protein
LADALLKGLHEPERPARGERMAQWYLTSPPPGEPREAQRARKSDAQGPAQG